MSLCLGGCCVPYTAIVPLCLIGIQWIASKLALLGLLPESVARRLGLKSNGEKTCGSSEKVKEGGGCCGCSSDSDPTKSSRSTSSRGKRGSREKAFRSASTTTTESSSSIDDDEVTPDATTNEEDNDSPSGLEHIDELSRWDEIFDAHSKRSNSTLIVKFTADWCKPCHAIQPCYKDLASKFSSRKAKFVSIDVDGDECDTVSSKLRIALMPTFVCFKNGEEFGRVSGGNDEQKLKNWVQEMCS